MSQANVKPATYADLEAAPDHLIAEIIGGVLSTRRYFGPRDGVPLGVLQRTVAWPSFRDRSPEAPMVILRPELYLDDDVVVPELAMWPRRQLNGVEDWRDVKVPPRWVAEFVTADSDLDTHLMRCRIYAKLGIQWMWRVDCVGKVLQVFERCDEGWMLTSSFSNDDVAVAPPFETYSFSISNLWSFDYFVDPMGCKSAEPTPQKMDQKAHAN